MIALRQRHPAQPIANPPALCDNRWIAKLGVTVIPNFVYWLDFLGVAVFAATGALAASRKQMDMVGFALLATLTGVGGGTVRDVILDRPVFWLYEETYLAICLGVAALTFFSAHLLHRRYPLLLWLDAIGLAAYGVLGAHLAFQYGTGVIVAAALGVITATFGGMMRDVISQETPLILRQELYATAALLAAAVYLGTLLLGGTPSLGAGLGITAGFALRGAAIRFGWALPRYRPREGRSY